MNNVARRSWQVAASCSRHQAFTTSAISSSRTLPTPVPIRPASQRDTPTPSNVYALTVAYPKHPLLAFFNRDVRTVKDSPNAKVGREVTVPATLRSSDLRKDITGRAWLAAELRTKSSLELHQLWYKCLMERNILATSASEIQRVGARQLVTVGQYNGRYIDRRIRKSMARIKFVLNERRLALLEARQRARPGRRGGADREARMAQEETQPTSGSLYE